MNIRNQNEYKIDPHVHNLQKKCPETSSMTLEWPCFEM